jgi:hypothetical protein
MYLTMPLRLQLEVEGFPNSNESNCFYHDLSATVDVQ